MSKLGALSALLSGGSLSITVYTKPSCVQCTATFRALDAKGITYETVDILENGDALVKIKELGYLQAPVVVAGLTHWSGFRPDKIASLIQ